MTAQEIRNRLECVQGDITTCSVDAVVNAANTSLLGGGGVDGAIHRAAGPRLVEECRTLGGCPTGDAKITQGYNLPARFVIHTVGPVYRNGRHHESALLESCYRNSLELAEQHHCRTVAFPAISCGAYGYPLEEAAEIAVGTVLDFLGGHDRPEKVLFVLFDRRTCDVYERVVTRLTG